jgi:UDP-2-acetamido-2-deoxy-ribo-hexuluronate aminotransferase
VIPFYDSAAAHARHAGAIDERLQALYRHGKFILGPEVAELETALARFVGVPHAITVKSGTMALELALRALDIGPGDEVITTPFSWVSAAEAIALVGARPVFADVDPATFLLDPQRTADAITPRTRALLPVSLFGQLPELEAFNDIAARHGLAVIEDGAQSFGATRHGKRSGAWTTIGTTSFFPTKPLGGYGDGGALFTSDDALAHELRALRNHGSTRRGEHQRVGLNGRLDTLQAAVLLAKLPDFEASIARRQHVASRYDAALATRVATPTVARGNTHLFAQYTLRLPSRDSARTHLANRGVETAVYYSRCLHQQPVFEGSSSAGSLQGAERVAGEVLSLPCHGDLDETSQARIIAALLECCRAPSP